MGIIFDRCSKGGCEWCYEDDLRYQKLIDILSEMHNNGIKDPETLCRANIFKHFKQNSPLFKEIAKMQAELFTLAYDHFLPWARNYVAI